MLSVGAVVWFPSTLALRHGFAFGCADGSVHISISQMKLLYVKILLSNIT